MCHLGGKQTQHPSIYALKTQILILNFTCGFHRQSWGILTGQRDEILLAPWINFTSVLRGVASCHHLIIFITKWNIVEISDIHIPPFRECTLHLPVEVSVGFYQSLISIRSLQQEKVGALSEWILLKRKKLFTFKIKQNLPWSSLLKKKRLPQKNQTPWHQNKFAHSKFNYQMRMQGFFC